MIRSGTVPHLGFTNALATIIGTVEAFSTIQTPVSPSKCSLAMTSISAVAGMVRVSTRFTLTGVPKSVVEAGLPPDLLMSGFLYIGLKCTQANPCPK